MRSGNSERMLSTAVPPLMTFTLGIAELAGWAEADSDVRGEIGPDERMCDIGQNQPPREIPA
jgi:hypothetical protein